MRHLLSSPHFQKMLHGRLPLDGEQQGWRQPPHSSDALDVQTSATHFEPLHAWPSQHGCPACPQATRSTSLVSAGPRATVAESGMAPTRQHLRPAPQARPSLQSDDREQQDCPSSPQSAGPNVTSSCLRKTSPH
jgi:hypothetical protein